MNQLSRKSNKESTWEKKSHFIEELRRMAEGV